MKPPFDDLDQALNNLQDAPDQATTPGGPPPLQRRAQRDGDGPATGSPQRGIGRQAFTDLFAPQTVPSMGSGGLDEKVEFLRETLRQAETQLARVKAAWQQREDELDKLERALGTQNAQLKAAQGHISVQEQGALALQAQLTESERALAAARADFAAQIAGRDARLAQAAQAHAERLAEKAAATEALVARLQQAEVACQQQGALHSQLAQRDAIIATLRSQSQDSEQRAQSAQEALQGHADAQQRWRAQQQDAERRRADIVARCCGALQTAQRLLDQP